MTAETENVGLQNLSSVNPTTFVPSTEPMRPNIIVMLIAIPLKWSIVKFSRRDRQLSIALTVNLLEIGLQ